VSGSVDPEAQKLSECRFEYVTETAYQENLANTKEGFSNLSSGGNKECEPTPSDIPQDESFHEVKADFTDLLRGTTYRYRLVATTEGVLGGTSESEVLAFTAPAAPRVVSASISNVSSQFAELHAVIDPMGAATSYYFEYSSNGAQWVDAPVLTEVAPHGVEVGRGGASGDADASVVQQVGPLQSDTTYRVRVVAVNEVQGNLETTTGPEGAEVTFTTLPASTEKLPDGRAYELVTPPNKGSAQDMFVATELEPRSWMNPDVGYASETGDQFLLETDAAFGAFAASSRNVYVFKRGERGWETIPLASPALGVQGIGSPVFEPFDFAQVGFADALGSEASESGQHNADLVGAPGGPYTTIHLGAGSRVADRTVIVGASRDLDHVVLESTNHTLAGGAEKQDPRSSALYEWEPIAVGGCTISSATFDESAAGCVELINVQDGSLLSRCGAVLGRESAPGTTHNAVSENGSEVIFTAPDPGLRYDPATSQTSEETKACWNGATNDTPQLYMRSGGETIEVSAPEERVSDPTGHHPAVYVGAAENGSRIFFMTTAELTKEAVELHLHDPELYEYNTEATEGKRLVRVSRGDLKSGPVEGDVFTVPAISANGAAVYFTAFGALAPGATALKDENGGPVNLYRYDTTRGTTVFVARVSKRDYPSTEAGGLASAAGLEGEVALASNANWYTTPDGAYLMFDSVNGLTSYNTEESQEAKDALGRLCPELDSGGLAPSGHCNEVYRYHYEPESPSGGSLICVSCDPSAAPPISNAFFAHSTGLDGPASPPVRAMPDGGEYVFFDSADPLVPAADNKTLDVYEWEGQGTGGCEAAQGCVHLISSAQSSIPSYFLGASPDGSDVFFGTHAKLVPQDTDTAGDVYDARTGGGFPVQSGKGPCEGNACENPASAPIEATPGSLTFSGPANPAPAPSTTTTVKKTTTKKAAVRCKKGFTKQHDRCVKRKKKSKTAKKARHGRRTSK
jgi:hypothetical protein